MSKYSQLITKLFDTNSKFVSEDFYEFVSEITKKYPNDRKKSKSTDQEGNEYVREVVAIFQDANDDKIAIMTIKLPSRTKVERARSQQRNLISAYLRNEGVFQGINSVLVAFYSDNSIDWRLSFVKQEFKLENNKIINDLTPAKRYSFLVESNSRNLTVKQRLGDLISDRILIANIEKAFSVEKVSKEFFEKYVGLYVRLSKAFEKDEVFKKVEEENNNGDEHFRENFVKKLLGQIVFLYFLQKKGWLGVKKDEKWGDGDKNFLQNQFRECKGGGNPKKESGGKNFFNDYLEWLFYDNLNRKRENDYSDYFECRIPYLNGGLFEPINGYDWKGVANILLAGDDNNAIFGDIFETFDEYNFTVYENDPLEQDVAVDPEMLGKVFENLLPENERKGKGAFYTPREIVHYMCKESLRNHLMNKTGISETLVNDLIDYKDSYLSVTKRGNKILDNEKFDIYEKFYTFGNPINDALKNIKIIDPAVGSGAFPMGILKEIVSLRKFLEENILLKENVSEYAIKKETLENCIYGVDLDPGAVEIAKLRFWLSLVIEEESKESIDPLPNLDYKIIQGNSLIEDIVVGETVIKLDIEGNSKRLTKKQSKEIGNASQIGLGFFADETEQEDTLKKLKFLHKKFFQEKDNINKKKLKEEIDLVEKELIRISGEVEVNRIRTKIESIEGKYLLSGLSPDTKDAKEIEGLSIQIQNIKDMEEKYKRDNVRTFFPWKLHFAEVFNENGGFDIVIGNPPYGAELSNTEKAFFKIVYSDVHTRTPDTFNYFISLAIRLSKTKGVSTYIVPNNLLFQAEYEKTRRFLMQLYKIKLVFNLGDGIFDSATVPSCVFICEKISQTGYEYFKYADFRDMEKSEIDFNHSLQVKSINKHIEVPGLVFGVSDSGFEVISKVRSRSTTIDSMAEEVASGISTGSDKIFRIHINDCNKYQLESRLLKKVLVGSDINKFFIKDSEYNLIYTKRDTQLDDYPNIKKYLSLSMDKLGQRSESKKGILPWYALGRQRYAELFTEKKIILRQTGDSVIATIDTDGYYTLNSILVFKINKSATYSYEFLLAVLNSSVTQFIYKNFTQEEGRTFAEVKPNNIRKLLIPNMGIDQQSLYIEIVNNIFCITKKDDYLGSSGLQAQVKGLEKDIDKMLYEFYELTPEEIELVEGSMKK